MRINRSVDYLRSFFRLASPPQLELSEDIAPVVEVGRTIPTEEILFTNTTIVAANGNVLTRITPPPGTDITIYRMSVELLVARNVWVYYDLPDISSMLYSAGGTTIYVLNRTVCPFIIPDGWRLTVQVVGMLLADGNGVIRTVSRNTPRGGIFTDLL